MHACPPCMRVRSRSFERELRDERCVPCALGVGVGASLPSQMMRAACCPVVCGGRNFVGCVTCWLWGRLWRREDGGHPFNKKTIDRSSIYPSIHPFTHSPTTQGHGPRDRGHFRRLLGGRDGRAGAGTCLFSWEGVCVCESMCCPRPLIWPCQPPMDDLSSITGVPMLLCAPPPFIQT